MRRARLFNSKGGGLSLIHISMCIRDSFKGCQSNGNDARRYTRLATPQNGNAACKAI
nr:hypothetical protein [Pseudomonas sp. HS-2]